MVYLSTNLAKSLNPSAEPFKTARLKILPRHQLQHLDLKNETTWVISQIELGAQWIKKNTLTYFQKHASRSSEMCSMVIPPWMGFDSPISYHGHIAVIHPVFWWMTIPWWPSSHSGRPEFCSRSMLSSVRNKPARVGTTPQGQGSARVFQFHKNEGYWLRNLDIPEKFWTFTICGYSFIISGHIYPYSMSSNS